jgi:aryl-alcohol dehydrogenase-like predicted oxidoreductase
MTVPHTSAVGRTSLGPSLKVPVQGIGTMGMAEFYGPTDEPESVATIRRALELGVTFVDTAYMYGGGRSEEIVGKALAGIERSAYVLATKCGLKRTETNVEIDGRPEHIRRAIDESLARLGVDHVDLYYLHRVDPNVPVEESIGAMSEIVAAGKARYLGISEAGEDSLRRAHETHPMAALQSEFSLCTREAEQTVLPACRELGIGFVAWGPLSRGLLAGRIRGAGFGGDDLRSILPRFAAGTIEGNVALVDRIAAVAARLEITTAQLALAWTVAQGAVPIPGAMTVDQLAENVGAVGIALDDETLAELDEIAPPGAFDGDRFHAANAAVVDE